MCVGSSAREKCTRWIPCVTLGVSVCVCVCVCVCMCVSVCVYVCVSVLCVFTHTCCWSTWVQRRGRWEVFYSGDVPRWWNGTLTSGDA